MSSTSQHNMRQLADEFLQEGRAIQTLLSGKDAADFDKITQFKGWTIYDVIAHLHLWNMAAIWTIEDAKNGSDKFIKFFAKIAPRLMAGEPHQSIQRDWAAKNGLGASGELYAAWVNGFKKTAKLFAQTAAEQRVKWGGPDMSAASCIIARQMESWAHAQAIFDILGQPRIDTDRLKNVAHIGVTTYSWSFKVRQQTPLTPKPYVKLTAPSGVIWEWNTPQNDNSITGDATEFCQVITQTRNIADTQLTCTGIAANKWMQIAQCFAGGVEEPPDAGTRFKVDP